MRSRNTYLSQFDAIPPCLCRIMARHGRGGHSRLLSVRELAARSGISKSQIAAMSYLESWKGVAIDVIDAFTEACGVDLCRPWITIAAIRANETKTWLKKANPVQKRMLAKIYNQRLSKQRNANIA